MISECYILTFKILTTNSSTSLIRPGLQMTTDGERHNLIILWNKNVPLRRANLSRLLHNFTTIAQLLQSYSVYHPRNRASSLISIVSVLCSRTLSDLVRNYVQDPFAAGSAAGQFNPPRDFLQQRQIRVCNCSKLRCRLHVSRLLSSC